ncbi:MAG: MOSC domain-containing protein [Gemmatimonadales bacterium]
MRTNGPIQMRVASLHYYPVKSCGGTSIPHATIDARGFVEDRAWMVTTGDGLFVTQRDMPRMALIRPCADAGALVLTAPGMPPLSVTRRTDGARRDVVVWDDICATLDQGDEPARWLSAFLGSPCRLVRMAEDFVRQTDPVYSTAFTGQVGFADGYPMLLITQASLDDLNRRLAAPLPMNRFRPNVVVSGTGPYAEDDWGLIRIGNVSFAVVKPCARCPITTTDQDTAETAQEPLRTLATYRHVRGKGVMFGQNLIHTEAGSISVGDPVEILEAARTPIRFG